MVARRPRHSGRQSLPRPHPQPVTLLPAQAAPPNPIDAADEASLLAGLETALGATRKRLDRLAPVSMPPSASAPPPTGTTKQGRPPGPGPGVNHTRGLGPVEAFRLKSAGLLTNSLPRHVASAGGQRQKKKRRDSSGNIIDRESQPVKERVRRKLRIEMGEYEGGGSIEIVGKESTEEMLTRSGGRASGLKKRPRKKKKSREGEEAEEESCSAEDTDAMTVTRKKKLRRRSSES